ncbi:immunoglobulin-like domain-containing protein [Formosa maritima]|uniref:DUF5011 domain-containing protein n=1 Tax=Formosa maritima TaxID=2592046 RepID=A0A5D0G091_9FLAO|nr:immunoglobulin-like domain-containing protein [Formosa maritima]TYA52278.1 DUF5011 domain-containing protein [Formosa maritima]
MKKTLLLFFLLSTGFVFSQNKSFWQKQTVKSNATIKASKQKLPQKQVYSLNIEALKQALVTAPKRESSLGRSQVIISFPNSEGEFERFSIKEASVMHPDLETRYPGIKSYAGQGVDDPSARIRFSISPLGLETMRLSANKPATFIEPLTDDLQQYTVYKRADVTEVYNDFECTVTENLNSRLNAEGNAAFKNADDATLRTYRLAMSATGEFTSYHGGTKALALAAINNTMTRVNGVFENDFNVTMVLIANTDAVIYTNSNNDPYGNSTSGYNSQLQSTLTSVIGESNYDIGHLVANLQNNGNAGCIGCVCVNGQKGSGWTSYTTPSGVNFDIDYVAHEMGHQFGGNHTFTFSNEGGTGAQMEPGSGSTIMGYAGITGSTDLQPHSDPYFHARTIEQITNYVKSTSCQTNTNTGNAVPSVSAGSNYTIPKGTAFVLEGSATDANSGDVLTYCWEQYNTGSSSTTNPSVNATSGPAFRSYIPTTDNKRYFPRLSTIKSGSTSWQWEAVPNVGRTLNFRLTVRDNRAGGANNNSDDMVVTVNGTAGPFVVNSPNTNVTWNAGTTQNVTWNVAGTTGNGVNAANVDIFLSTDGGDTYPITLATGVPNDGSQNIVVPNNQGTQNRIMVKGSNNIFFDISNSNFTIAGQVVCNATVPTGLAASNVGSSSATLSWNAVPGATYDLRYRVVGTSVWTTNAVTGISSGLSGLNTLTQYEAQVRSKCNGGSNSAYSSSVNFTTTDVQLNYCTSASTNINDEYIGRVQLNTINNASGAQFYSDFTGISTTLTKDTQYTITITPTWTGTVYNEGYSVWIDYNRDGDFTDSGEQVWTKSASKTTPVSGSFTIPSGAVENSTRMRVSMKYNGIPSSCETFQYGEVEDYTVIIEGSGPDTTPPVITLNGASTINLNVGESYTELGATATDNIDGNLTSSIEIGGDTVNTNIGGTYVVTYNVSDAAGNDATEVIRTVNIIPDTTAPVITLNGVSTINLFVGDTYTELGATATDNIDGNLTSSIVITGTVNTASAGTYTRYYNVSDAAGNAATQRVRTIVVTVIVDTTAPVITLNGASTINLFVGDTYNELGATATDNIDGNLTSSIVITGTVNTASAGAYTRNYNVSDAAGNAATQRTRTIIVTEPSMGCTAGISSFPYSESYENTLGAWTQGSGDDFNWALRTGGTPSSNTGPSSANAGSYYIYMESSSPNYSTKRAILNSPCFDLSGATQATFEFKYHMYGASSMGSLALELSNDNGMSWTSVWSRSGNQGNSWQTASINLNAYVGSSIQLRFNGVTGTTWQGDMAIDAVSLSTNGGSGPSCSNITLSIKFDNYPEETAWSVRNSSGTTIASGGTYGSQADGSTLNINVGCLDDGCYDFIITDTYGDGICCSYGSGSYTLTNSDTGETLASGGQFTSSQTTNFCLGGISKGLSQGTISDNPNQYLKVYPNPVNQILNVDLVGYEAQSFEVKNMLGQTVLKGRFTSAIDVSKFEAGVYLLQLNIGEKTRITRFIKK